ncbi:hypothetical protein TSO352_21570 [Azospirillum sp. TSO35-2]|nr:hypothetical protein TSO352_21570 [Azospirillum sp. TSO35-2]
MGGAELAALLDVVGEVVGAALDPMLALVAAALESPLLPRQQDRLVAVRTAGTTLRATLEEMRAVARDVSPAADGTILLGGLVEALRSRSTARGRPAVVTVEDGTPDRLAADAVGLRSLLTLLMAEGGATLSLSVRPDALAGRAAETAELIIRRRGEPGLRALALAVARPLVQRLGGRIAEDGAGADAGERLTIRLPVRPVRSGPPAPPAALSVLLVEDNPIGRLVAAGFFKALGHAVTTAEDGAQGLTAATAGRFDLIVMDVQMPVMDGHEATRAIRALPGDAGRVPIVALTAGSVEEDDARCREAGMDDCLHKPLTMDRLRTTLDLLFPGRFPA